MGSVHASLSHFPQGSGTAVGRERWQSTRLCVCWDELSKVLKLPKASMFMTYICIGLVGQDSTEIVAAVLHTIRWKHLEKKHLEISLFFPQKLSTISQASRESPLFSLSLKRSKKLWNDCLKFTTFAWLDDCVECKWLHSPVLQTVAVLVEGIRSDRGIRSSTAGPQDQDCSPVSADVHGWFLCWAAQSFLKFCGGLSEKNVFEKYKGSRSSWMRNFYSTLQPVLWF